MPGEPSHQRVISLSEASTEPSADTVDVAIVGAGAAGLAAGIFLARDASHLRVRCLDGARVVGAKILVSGGSRCNVTNRVVGERDFWGGSPRIIKHVLRAFPATRAVAFFEELGVALHEEEDGKLFPDTNRSRTVLDALLAEAARRRVEIHQRARVVDVERRDNGTFVIHTEDGGTMVARAVVLATGGRSLPKSGSDGAGYALARRLGHGYVETTPALVPMLLGDDWHGSVSGVTVRAALELRVDGRRQIRLVGPLLWTHMGASGPVVLNLSRHWHRAHITGQTVTVTASLCPDETFETTEAWLLEQMQLRPRAQISTVLATRLPAALASVCATAGGIDPDQPLAHVRRDDRRRLAGLLTALPLDVRGSRGYGYAEATAGGVPLDEIDATTLQSRVCPGLFLAGEMLDVDGRLGGFNFQWAWSSAWVAARGIARLLGAAAG